MTELPTAQIAPPSSIFLPFLVFGGWVGDGEDGRNTADSPSPATPTGPRVSRTHTGSMYVRKAAIVRNAAITW